MNRRNFLLTLPFLAAISAAASERVRYISFNGGVIDSQTIAPARLQELHGSYGTDGCDWKMEINGHTYYGIGHYGICRDESFSKSAIL